MLDLGAPAGKDSYADAINRRGEIIGHGDTPGGGYDGLFWENRKMTVLQFSASAINERGQVVGTAPATHEVLWENGKMSNLGALHPGWVSNAHDINDQGLIVGSSERLGSGNRSAVLWENGPVIDLGTLDGSRRMSAHAINNRGQIIGISGSVGELRGFFLAGRLDDRPGPTLGHQPREPARDQRARAGRRIAGDCQR